MSMPWKKLAPILVALVVIMSAMHYFHSDGAAATPAHVADNPGVPVKTASAISGDMDIVLTVVARTEAWSTVTVRSRIDGQLDALAFSPGAKVNKGALLAQLDPLPLKAQLDQASGDMASAQAKLDKAQADLHRYSQVLAKGFVSRADYDAYNASVEVDRANVQSHRAAVELAKLQLGYTHIVAPFEGVAGLPQVWPGAQLAANTTDIVVLKQIEPIRVSFSIPEGSLDAVRAARGRGRIIIKARLPDDSSAPRQGTLDFIDNTVDSSTGTIVLKGRFENTDDRLTPGQFLEVELPTTRLVHAVTVPSPALQSSDKGDFVFVVGADGKAHQRFVNVGPSRAGRIVINKGLQAGEQVVTDGQLLLTDGTPVHVAVDA